MLDLETQIGVQVRWHSSTSGKPATASTKWLTVSPIEHLIAPPGNRYMTSGHPLKAESQRALAALLAAALLAAGH